MGKPHDKRRRKNAPCDDRGAELCPRPGSPNEAYRLLKDFLRIEDPSRRAQIIRLVREMAEQDQFARPH